VDHVTVGRPLANVWAIVVDPTSGCIVPFGVAGELWVGGVGVAKGYVGLETLTAERFGQDVLKMVDGSRGGGGDGVFEVHQHVLGEYGIRGRVFRTGDLARVLYTSGDGGQYKRGSRMDVIENGEFEILGRMDDQVKLGGYRVELDEIASAILKLEGTQFIRYSLLKSFFSC
jgi:non-ribosomal peptide synthetase component F